MTADIVFRNATVLDGSGKDGYVAEVAVTGDRIAAIGKGLPRARREVDAEGHVLCPGFIDMHAHSDLQILANPDHTAKVSQGVTTEVLGQDGLSFAPVDDATRTGLRVLFDPATVRDTATFEEPRQQAEGIPWVLVNGTPVIEAGQRSDACPGRALRRTPEGAQTR